MSQSEYKYDGSFYREIGNFLKEKYLDYGFTKGTVQEVDFVVNLLHLQAANRVLDVGCGPGRHSLELSRRGIRTTGVDISEGFIALANQAAQTESLPAEFHVADARQMAFSNEFDAAICLCEGAFGLAGDDEGHRKVLDGVFNALRPGGQLVLSAINASGMVRRLQAEDKFDAYTSTISEQETLHSPTGETRAATIYTTGFTYRELKLLLERAGFEVIDGYGCVVGRFEKKPLAVDDMEIMVWARKPA